MMIKDGASTAPAAIAQYQDNVRNGKTKRPEAIEQIRLIEKVRRILLEVSPPVIANISQKARIGRTIKLEAAAIYA